MDETNETKSSARQSGKRTRDDAVEGFTDEERAAMLERARELKAAERRGSKAAQADGEADVLAKIAEMSQPDRWMAERLHAIIKASAPELASRTWYGMPAYTKDGTVVCFYQAAEKFKARYAMLGFGDKANLDDGPMWPVYYALSELTPEVEAQVSELIKRAVS